MYEILKVCFSHKVIAFSLMVLLYSACQENDGPSEREIALEYLTNNSEKYWELDESTIDGQPITLNICDSSYNLIMKADFTWEEVYRSLQCNAPVFGQWSLNEESNVISINYINFRTGMREERHFEILELSEEILAYQIAENNRLKYVRLKRRE